MRPKKCRLLVARTFSPSVRMPPARPQHSPQPGWVMMAPAAGFYTTPGSGKNEVRIAYVLKKEDLTRALFVLRKALEAYPGRVLE